MSIKMPHEYRQQVVKKCPVCDQRFRALKTAAYCSDACKSKAARQRRKAAAK